jgi:hypothetical protein
MVTGSDREVFQFDSYQTISLQSLLLDQKDAVEIFCNAFLVVETSQVLSCNETIATILYNFGLCCHIKGSNDGKSMIMKHACRLYLHALRVLESDDRPSHTPRSSGILVLRAALCHNLQCLYALFYEFEDALIMRENSYIAYCSMLQHTNMMQDEDIEFLGRSFILHSIIDGLRIAPAA